MRNMKTGGRKKGTPNRVTREIGDAAREYSASALHELDRLAHHAKSEAVRVAACRELLDRGHGRAPQGISLTGGDAGPITHIIKWKGE
jgi:hypothetical protein